MRLLLIALYKYPYLLTYLLRIGDRTASQQAIDTISTCLREIWPQAYWGNDINLSAFDSP